MNALDATLNRLAARQHGVVGRRQLRDLGLTGRQVDSRKAAGALVPVHRGVYRVAGAPMTPRQALMAACLVAGDEAVASHRSAAALWELRGVGWPAPEILVPGPGRPTVKRARIHRTGRLERGDVTRRDGIPVTTPGRTLLDLGAVAPVLVEPAMEDALFRGLVSEAALRRLLDRVGTNGRNGAGVLRDLLDGREPGQRPTESPLEDALIGVLRRYGLPEPVRQHPVVLADGREARIDLAYPERKLGIEADGRRWHSGRADFERDRARGNGLVADGWTMLRFGSTDVRRRGRAIATQVGALLS